MVTKRFRCEYSVIVLCLEISTSGYYAWLKRQDSPLKKERTKQQKYFQHELTVGENIIEQDFAVKAPDQAIFLRQLLKKQHDDRHYGRQDKILENIHEVYENAKKEHPERWASKTRNWEPVLEVELNSEKEQIKCKTNAAGITLKKAA